MLHSPPLNLKLQLTKSAVTHKATKRALTQMVESLADDLREAGLTSIGVHNLSPGAPAALPWVTPLCLPCLACLGGAAATAAAPPLLLLPPLLTADLPTPPR